LTDRDNCKRLAAIERSRCDACARQIGSEFAIFVSRVCIEQLTELWTLHTKKKRKKERHDFAARGYQYNGGRICNNTARDLRSEQQPLEQRGKGKEDQQRRGGGRREANAKGRTGAGAPILLLTADLAAAALSAGRLAASGRCLLGGRSGRGALDRLAGNLATLALVDQRLKKKNNNTTRQNAHKSTTIHLLLHHLTFSSFPLRDLILMCDLVDVLKK